MSSSIGEDGPTSALTNRACQCAIAILSLGSKEPEVADKDITRGDPGTHFVRREHMPVSGKSLTECVPSYVPQNVQGRFCCDDEICAHTQKSP